MWIMRKSTIPDLPFFARPITVFTRWIQRRKTLELLREEMEAFEKEQGFWLEDYCLYMASEGRAWRAFPGMNGRKELKTSEAGGTWQQAKTAC